MNVLALEIPHSSDTHPRLDAHAMFQNVLGTPLTQGVPFDPVWCSFAFPSTPPANESPGSDAKEPETKKKKRKGADHEWNVVDSTPSFDAHQQFLSELARREFDGSREASWSRRSWKTATSARRGTSWPNCPVRLLYCYFCHDSK
eukprot:3517044-Rhodomonas_salina.1